MNNYCRKLNLPFELPLIDFSAYKKFPRNQIRCSNDLIGSKFSQWLAESANAQLYWSEIFYLAPNADHSIHCDGNELDNKVKINLIVGGRDSKMIWYEPNSEDKVIKKVSPANTLYLTINLSDTVNVYEELMTGLYIVNVGMFHNVYNKNEDRYCISMAIADLDSDKRLTYHELVKRIFNE
jgi:hypothetical protein